MTSWMKLQKNCNKSFTLKRRRKLKKRKPRSLETKKSLPQMRQKSRPILNSRRSQISALVRMNSKRLSRIYSKTKVSQKKRLPE